MRRYVVVSALVLAGLLGCQSSPLAPELAALYNEAAQHHDETTNPVIVIPGILGTRLEDPNTGAVVWGAFAPETAGPSTPEGARLIAHPLATDGVLSSHRDSVEAAGVLDRLEVRLGWLPIQLDAYRQILLTLGAGGYRDEELGEAGAVDYGDEHYTCFQFPYDWRRDNVESAQALHTFIQDVREYVAEQRLQRFGTRGEPVRVHVVAHSMGGLVARYYMRYGAAPLPADGATPEVTWAGAQHVDRVVLVATPNAGSAQALIQLAEGIRFAPFLPRYSAGLLGTFPSLYQLLPRPRHGAYLAASTGTPLGAELYDPQLWQANGWGAAALTPQQRAWLVPGHVAAEADAAVATHLAACLARAEQFHRALDQPAEPPPNMRLHLIAGDAVPTAATLRVTEAGAVEVSSEAPGDGTVLRSSALLDERMGQTWQPRVRTPIDWQQVTFLFTDHLGLTSDPAFTDNVLYQLLEAP